MSEVQINEIPIWCDKIFNEEQKDPDKDPGFMVTTRLWAQVGDLLMEASFMFVGQDNVTLIEQALRSGTVYACTVHWKGKCINAEHDMKGKEPIKGDPLKINLNNLGYLGSAS